MKLQRRESMEANGLPFLFRPDNLYCDKSVKQGIELWDAIFKVENGLVMRKREGFDAKQVTCLCLFGDKVEGDSG